MTHVSKRILIVSNIPPLDKVGSGIRTIELYRIFERIGFSPSIYVIYPIEWGAFSNSVIDGLKTEYNILKVHYFSLTKFISRRIMPDREVLSDLRHLEGQYDYILFRFEQTALICGFWFLSNKVIIDYDDFSYPRKKAFYMKPYHWIKLLIERKKIYRALVLEQKHLSYFNGKAILIPNLPLVALENHLPIVKNMSSNPSLLFVGSHSIKWLIEFIEQEWIGLLNKFHNLEFHIITQSSDISKLDLVSYKQIYAHQDVENLKPFYERCWLSVIPTFNTYGTLIKVLEPIFYKTPVVTSSICIRGYEDFNKEEEVILHGNTYNEISEKIVSILKDRDRIIHISEQGHKIAQNLFSFKVITDRLKNSLNANV